MSWRSANRFAGIAVRFRFSLDVPRKSDTALNEAGSFVVTYIAKAKGMFYDDAKLKAVSKRNCRMFGWTDFSGKRGAFGCQ